MSSGRGFCGGQFHPISETSFARHLINPCTFLKQGSEMHRRFEAYRSTGGKLHTTCYRAHPPKGASGPAFTAWICRRAGEFVGLGQRCWALLQDVRACRATTGKVPLASNIGTAVVPESSSSGSDYTGRLCTLLTSHNGVGPTMAKMFMVTTHLRYPELGLLDKSCEVGDGAAPALAQLFGLIEQPSLQTPCGPEEFTPRRLRPSSRRCLLVALGAYLQANADAIDPRLLPMVRWTVGHTRCLLGSSVPAEALPLGIAIFELQVNLCEWRKFCDLDPLGIAVRGAEATTISRAYPSLPRSSQASIVEVASK